VVFANFDGRISKERQHQLMGLFGMRSRDLQILEEQEANLEHVIARDSIAIVRNQFKVTSLDAIDRIYEWLATFPVNQALWEKTAGILREGGVFKLCGGDTQLIQGLAFLGVASSVCRDRKELVDVGKTGGIDVLDLLQKLKLIEQSSGLPLLAETEKSIMTLL
jgi:hypothetical protein